MDRRSLTTVLSAATSSLGVPLTLQAQHKYEKEEQQQPDNPFAAFAYSSSDDDGDEADEQARMEKKLEKERAKSAGDSIVRAEVVSEFLESLYKICKWTSECHIIAFILMVRTVHMSEGKVRGATRESIARRNSMRAQHIPE